MMKNIIKKYWKIELINILYFGIFSTLIITKILPHNEYIDMAQYLFLVINPIYALLYGVLTFAAKRDRVVPNILFFVSTVVCLVVLTFILKDYRLAAMINHIVYLIWASTVLTIVSCVGSSIAIQKINSKTKGKDNSAP